MGNQKHKEGSPKWHILPTPHDVGQKVVGALEEAAKRAVTARGEFVIAFSGGSIPELIGKALQRRVEEIGGDDPLALSRWIVIMADERIVTPIGDHAESNYAAVRKFLPSNVGCILSIDPDAEDVAQNYDELVAKKLGKRAWTVDVMLLGVGPDGHTCSLFPSHELLERATESSADHSAECIGLIENSPKPPPRRVTMLFGVINRTRDKLIFVAVGAGKKPILDSIQKSFALPIKQRLPAARIAPAVAGATLHWYIDQAAAPASISQLQALSNE